MLTINLVVGFEHSQAITLLVQFVKNYQYLKECSIHFKIVRLRHFSTQAELSDFSIFRLLTKFHSTEMCPVFL